LMYVILLSSGHRLLGVVELLLAGSKH
jgi:hypothetical protein